MAAPSASQTRAAVVIPARLGSTRFPRKVLARETGRYLIQHVWEGVLGTPGVERVIIATDSEEVLRAARSFGAEACLTSTSHRTGTDRVAEVARSLPVDIVVNVQGDEPLIRREDVARVVALFEEGGPEVSMTTLAVEKTDPRDFADPNNVKVVLDARGRALYFSRAPIPFDREGSVRRGSPRRQEGVPEPPAPWLHHVGIYGFRREFLLRFTSLPAGRLEETERLEQLRALENGFSIQVGITTHPSQGIDTREEYQEFVRAFGAAGPGGAARPDGGGGGREGE